MFDLIQMKSAMLAIDHDEVIANRAEKLDEVRRITADDGTEYNLTIGEFGFCGIGLHNAFVPP
jgi:hypothetical protein